MKRQPALYTFKVWLWSAVASPVIAAIVQFYINEGKTENIGSAIVLYPAIFVFEILLTFLLWVLFWTLTAICSNLISNDIAFRWAASLIGLIIAAVLCWFIVSEEQLMLSDRPPSLNDLFFDIALANCLCIFAGCWYFDIGKPVPNTITLFNHQCYEHTNE